MEDFIPIGMEQSSKEVNIIKVIGVGGGGSNAVNNMYKRGINGVSFVVCNTDNKALDDSPVPVHLQLGNEGLGAGNKPAVGKQKAEESIDQINQMLDDGTKMVFITAGMGGGTGTGAAPVIAKASMEKDILTVGIVTIPFAFEGNTKIDHALEGVEEMAKYVDALLVINNERLRDIYTDLSFMDAFQHADDTLTVAAKSIAEITTVHGYINLDFNDVRTVLKDGGVAIISTGYGQGENRVRDAIEDALNSPLLNDNDVYNSQKILLSITAAAEEGKLMMEELNAVHVFMEKFDTNVVETKWGVAFDPELGDKVKVTILASGFGLKNVYRSANRNQPKPDLTEAQLAEQEEEQEKRAKRRHMYYGSDLSHTKSKKRPAIYIFSKDDIDNDDKISAIEQSPTYNRSRKRVEELHMSGDFSGKEAKPSVGDSYVSTSGTILFGD